MSLCTWCSQIFDHTVYIYIYIHIERETSLNRNLGITETYIQRRSFTCPRIWCPIDPYFEVMEDSWNGNNFGPLGFRFRQGLLYVAAILHRLLVSE